MKIFTRFNESCVNVMPLIGT